MKKICLLIVALLFTATSCHAIDVTFSIDQNQAEKLIKIIDTMFPIPDDDNNGEPDRTYPEQFKYITIQFWTNCYRGIDKAEYRSNYVAPEGNVIS